MDQYNDDLSTIFSLRFQELISTEKNQEKVAEKLFTHQTNISMWKKGKRLPKADDLFRIAQLYDVSVDWLLGLSDDRKRGHIHLETLTYQQLFLLMDLLLEKGIIEHARPNNGVAYISPIMDITEKGLWGSISELGDAEEEMAEEDNECSDPVTNDKGERTKVIFEPYSRPEVDYSSLVIQDQALLFALRRRNKMKEIGDDVYEDWKTKTSTYEDIPLLDYTGNAKDLMDMKVPATMGTDADWAGALREINNMTEEQRAELIERRNKKEA